jgi:hypothetical protein
VFHGQLARQLQLEQRYAHAVDMYQLWELTNILPLFVANALPVEGWTSDPNDKALLDALPVLDSLRFTSDVRRVLGIRGF